jgi:predicted nucleotidyltransferase
VPAVDSAVSELDIRGILGELVREGVEFLVIGGIAVGYHGHIRATKDVDVVPAPNIANLEKLARVLKRLDLQWIANDALWEKLSPAAIEDEIDGLPIKMVGYADLVALKEQAGRPEDLADLQRLREAREET